MLVSIKLNRCYGLFADQKQTYLLSTTLYCVALLLMKIAILLEWSHIFIGTTKRNAFYWVCYGMIILNTGLYFATIISITFACNPRERTWRRYLPGTCINLNAFNIIIASLHLGFDIVMLLLPQIVIWKLNLARKHKIGISVVFAVGVLYVPSYLLVVINFGKNHLVLIHLLESGLVSGQPAESRLRVVSASLRIQLMSTPITFCGVWQKPQHQTLYFAVLHSRFYSDRKAPCGRPTTC